jgi:hypothetical protein
MNLVMTLILIMLILPGCSAATRDGVHPVEQQAAAAPAVVPQPSTEESLRELMEFPACKSKESPARKRFLARQIARILDAHSEDVLLKQVFSLQICKESRFNPTARSPVGARGIAQVMPTTATLVAKQLGLGELRPEDLDDVELNTTIGFSYFLGLVRDYKGNIASAMAAYNAGPASSSVKGMTRLQNGNIETGWYVANIFWLMEEQRIAAKKGVGT